MSRIRIIFAGSGEFGLPTLGRLVESEQYELVQVVTQPDRPSGRGLKLTATAVAKLSLERALPLVRTDNINQLQLPPADVMVVIAFGQKIAPHVVDHPGLGSINLHASLLPKYRGAAPINWAIINGERITGNSVIRLAAKMDAGAILGQMPLTIGDTDTAGEIHDRLADDGAALVAQVLDQLVHGTAVEQPQKDAEATLAPKLRRQHALLDWTRTATALANQIRGMYPWPGCHVRLLEAHREITRLTLVRVRAVTLSADVPGKITDDGEIATGSGALEVLELQPEGKRPMSLDAFRHGHRWEAGMRLESITS